MLRESINSRAIDAINYLLSDGSLHSKSSLASELGISASKFSEILGKRMKAGTDVLAGLSSEFGISSQWLLTGEGDMIQDNSTLQISPPESDTHAPEVQEMPATDEFEYVNNDNGGKIPVVHELAFATIDPEDPGKIKADEVYYIKEFRNADFLMKMQGDYMSPKYRSGDLLACRNVKEDCFYQWGRIYALLTCHQGLIIGRVYEHFQNTIFVTVKPANPDYPEWVVPIDEIVRIALVIGSISFD